MIGRLGRAVVVDLFVEDFVLLGVGPHLILGKLRAALVAERPDGYVFQAVAGRTDLGIDLQPALELQRIETAERAFEGEVHVLDMGLATRRLGCAAREGQRQGHGDRCTKFTEHRVHHTALTRPV